MNPHSPTDLVQLLRQNRQAVVDARTVIQSGGSAISVIPKLVTDPKTPGAPIEAEDRMMLDRSVLEELSRGIQARRRNHQDIIQLFPDIELCIQIMVGSILSPKKMTDVSLIYSLAKSISLPPALSAKLISTIGEYITEEYALEDKLSDILREALYETGSHCIAVIPEASVDELINSDLTGAITTEAFQMKADKLMDELVGEPATGFDIAAECANMSEQEKKFFTLALGPSSLRVSTNIKLFHFPDVKDKITSKIVKSRARSSYGTFATEAGRAVEYLDVFRQRTRTPGSSNVSVIRSRDEARRKSVGKPMTAVFPSASVIPVGIPGNEKEHVVYLVLTDENGRPLDYMSSPTQFAAELSGNYTQQAGGGSNPIQTAHRGLIAGEKPVNSEQLYRVYKTVLERQLYQTVKSSLFGKDVKITDANDIYFMMFCRALAGQRTNIVVVPKEMMVYFAFDYNDYGIGKSLMDDLIVLSGLRAVVLFSKVMSEAKSAIDVTSVNVTLDPNDPDKKKTMRTIQDAVMKGRKNDIPFGHNNYNDVTAWVQRAGLRFNFSAVEGLPDTRVEFENSNLQHNVGDTETESNLGKQMIKAMGVPPELVDNAWGPDFASTGTNNNVILSKRVKIYQKKLSVLLSKLVGLYVYTDEHLRDKLRKAINDQADAFEGSLEENEKALFTKNKEAFIEEFLDKLSEGVVVKLPEPENTNLTNMAASYQLYKASLVEMFDSVLSSEIFTEDMTGVFSAHIDSLKNNFVHLLLRRWCADNNYFPEALAFTSSNKEDMEALTQALTGHITDSARTGSIILRMLSAVKEAIAKDLANVSGEGGESVTADSPDTSIDSGSDGEDGGGGDNMDDFGGDDMTGDDLLKL